MLIPKSLKLFTKNASKSQISYSVFAYNILQNIFNKPILLFINLHMTFFYTRCSSFEGKILGSDEHFQETLDAKARKRYIKKFSSQPLSISVSIFLKFQKSLQLKLCCSYKLIYFCLETLSFTQKEDEQCLLNIQPGRKLATGLQQKEKRPLLNSL